MEAQLLSDEVNPDLLVKIAKKQQDRKESFAKLRKEYILDGDASAIVQLSVEELHQQLQTRQLKAVQVLRAYIAKALEVTEKCNCVTEFNPKAMELAAALDSRTGPALPLHGLPVAIKDDYDIEGMDTTLGYAKNLFKPAKESSVIVKVLQQVGAVPFLKTNIPQSLFAAAGDNPIFGHTTNGRNNNLAPGGSSAGSGSLVSAGGAPFATGSDLGGSLRIPSHFNGVSTLRPTIGRLSGKGLVQCVPILVGITGVPGIISSDVKTLSLVWKAITENGLQNQHDPLVVPIPWNEKLFASQGKLRLGYFSSAPFFPAFKDTQDTVIAAKTALESRGHKIVPFEMFDQGKILGKCFDLYLADHGRYLLEMFSGEPVSSCVSDLISSIKKMWKNEATEATTEREKILARRGGDIKTADDLSKLLNERQAIILNILERFEKAGVDLLLTPAYPYPALGSEHEALTLPGIIYTAIWNFVDFPAGIVRFGTESGKNIESYDDQGEKLFKDTKDALKHSTGAPICVQVVGQPFKEELVLRTFELENARKSQK